MADVNTLSSFRRTKIALLALAATAFLAGLLTQTASATEGSGGVGAGGAAASAPSGSSSTGANTTPAKYNRLWETVTPVERRWAAKTSYCETGRDPDATALNGDYRGAFMFTWDAWRTSPKTPGGDPIDYSYRTQAVVAVMLKRSVGTGPWPVCG
jgi:Transglycosylase-like domain